MRARKNETEWERSRREEKAAREAAWKAIWADPVASRRIQRMEDRKHQAFQVWNRLDAYKDSSNPHLRSKPEDVERADRRYKRILHAMHNYEDRWIEDYIRHKHPLHRRTR